MHISIASNTSAIANAILINAKNQDSLLNWDGETTNQDLIENIKSYVLVFTGWCMAEVTFSNNQLEIWGSDGEDVKLLLVYNVKTYKEIYGRLSHVGFYRTHLEELKSLSN